MKKILIALSVVLLAAVAFTGCQESAPFEDVIMITGTTIDPMIKFPIETAPETTSLSVTTSGPVDMETVVTFAVDPSALDAYNKLNGTAYVLAPEECYELQNPEVTIKAGKTYSNAATIEVLTMEGMDEGTSYVIPVSIVSTTGDMAVLEASRTAYMRISRVSQFRCVDVTPTSTNAHGYRTYYFAEPYEMETFTFEYKFYIDAWHTGANSTKITRLMNWGPGDDNPFGRIGSSMNLMRLGEGGYDQNQLQWLHSQGAIGSNTRFELATWYLLTCTYDGMTYRLYINGKLDNQMDGTGKKYYFDSWEIGMSWDGESNQHPMSQRIPGRLSEMRVWNRALKAKEINTGLCGVPSDSPGLVAYWKMDDADSGSSTAQTFRDYTGGGRDLNWTSKSTGSKKFATVYDNKNKCAQ